MTHIRIERDGAVALLTIDRPERFNSLDVETAHDFRKAGLLSSRATRRCAPWSSAGRAESSAAART